MQHYICKTCGIQYEPTEHPPSQCIICEDERQYIGYDGQQWLIPSELRATHKNILQEEAPNLLGIGVTPKIAIGQRALLVQSSAGNVLWDCAPLLEQSTIDAVNELGGLTAIAISHPHFYANMVTWSKAFDVPIYLHENDQQWVTEAHDAIHFWQGDTFTLNDDMTLIRCAGHFEGGQVLHWQSGANNKGALLTGDILFVTQDRRYVSFMYSFPNYIPLSSNKIKHIMNVLEPYDYDRIYSAWFGSVSTTNAKANVAYSAQRYLNAITDQ